MSRLAGALAAFTGWRRFLLALLLGAMAAGGLAPIELFAFMLISFTGLIWLLDGCTRGIERFLCGWTFGFGFFLAGLHWLAFPLLIDAPKFGWMVPFTILLVPGGLALFTGLATLCAGWIAQEGWQRIVSLAVFWTLMEWIRGQIFTGFPWNLIGYAWVEITTVSQSASFLGVYGLSLLTILVAASPAQIGQAYRVRWLFPVVAASVLLMLHFWGAERLAKSDMAEGEVVLRLVQPNIAQGDKWADHAREENLIKHVDLSLKPGFGAVDAIIWPETASTYLLKSGSVALQLVGSVAPLEGIVIAGAPRTIISQNDEFRLFNSLVVVDENSRILDFYDKHHLVPFGEFLPFRKILARFGADKLAAGSVDYSAGSGPTTMRLKGIPSFSPLICYEAIFPREVVDLFNRPQWLLSITNDAWFGPNAGPLQHFQMARLRAIEEGLPLVRVANTGISGLIDPYGRVRKQIQLGSAGFLDVALPHPLLPTIYSIYGNSIAFTVGLLLIAAAALRGIFSLVRPE